jgi:hypothetical protein
MILPFSQYLFLLVHKYNPCLAALQNIAVFLYCQVVPFYVLRANSFDNMEKRNPIHMYLYN